MASDYITEQMEEEHREAVHVENMREVAIHMINGMTEDAAIMHVEDIQASREEAINKGEVIQDENGNIEGFIDPELDAPSNEGHNPKQIYAIQQKLLEK